MLYAGSPSSKCFARAQSQKGSSALFPQIFFRKQQISPPRLQHLSNSAQAKVGQHGDPSKPSHARAAIARKGSGIGTLCTVGSACSQRGMISHAERPQTQKPALSFKERVPQIIEAASSLVPPVPVAAELHGEQSGGSCESVKRVKGGDRSRPARKRDPSLLP